MNNSVDGGINFTRERVVGYSLIETGWSSGFELLSSCAFVQAIFAIQITHAYLPHLVTAYLFRDLYIAHPFQIPRISMSRPCGPFLVGIGIFLLRIYGYLVVFSMPITITRHRLRFSCKPSKVTADTPYHLNAAGKLEPSSSRYFPPVVHVAP